MQFSYHATCSYISGSGYTYGPIRKCLFTDYIIISIISQTDTCIHTFAEMSVRSGIVMVWTRFPFTISRISIESGVKAITYGKAQTETK